MILRQFARSQATMRCTISYYPNLPEDQDYVTRKSTTAEVYVQSMPCLWWMEILSGQGEIERAERALVYNTSRMLIFPATGELIDTSMIITNIRDRNGNALDSSTWSIQSIIPRPTQGGQLLMLERVM